MKQPISERLNEKWLLDVHHQTAHYSSCRKGLGYFFSLSVYRFVVGYPDTVPQEKNALWM